jgi:2-dehydro-3-deoxyphosphogalactonate aldolase
MARHLKLFPASTYGPGHLRQLAAVLPATATVWAVGGVGAADLEAWWSAGARGFGVGSEIYRPGQTAEVTFEKAKRFVASAIALS